MPKIGSVIYEDVESIVNDLKDLFRILSGTSLLVTGAGGFLCSYFVDTVAMLNRVLLTQPCKIIAVDNFQTGLSERLVHLQGREDVCFIKQDLRLPLNLNQPVDWIIHGASIASPKFYRRYPLETIDVNVTGTRQVLEFARRGVHSLLYLSTSEVYGNPDPDFIPTPENYLGYVSSTGPRACYDESKRLAETLCNIYYRLYNVPVKIVRIFNTYGPGQRLDDGRIIIDMVNSIIHNQPIVLYSDGRPTRSFCYISDAISAMWHVLLSNANGEVFNAGNGQEEISIRDLAERVCQLANLPLSEIKYQVSDDLNYLTDNPERRCPDLTKLSKTFHWEPKVSLNDGVARTLRYYREMEL